MPAYKNEKTGKWFCSFWVKDWTGKRTKKKKEGFTTKRDALAYENEYKSVRNGSPNMTLNALYVHYMNDSRARTETSSMETKKQFFKKILPFFGNMPINEIQPATVRKWQNEIINAGYSRAYQKGLNTALNAIFNYAVKYYNLAKNPVSVAGSIGSFSREEITFWTLDEYNKFISALKEGSAERLAIEMLFYTGMRNGELRALTPADIDGGRLGTMTDEEVEKFPHVIKISHSMKRDGNKEVMGTPKTDSSYRTVSIPLFLAKDLQSYIKKSYEIGMKDRLFPRGKMWIGYIINKNVQRAGVKRIRAHDLRHSHASLLINMGCSPLVIKERLGHSNIKETLQIYSHLYPSQAVDLMGKLEKLGGA